ncbi:MAG: efflux RND transporter periplasmic adaptor subunit [Reichenbachiella sp.]|uniref:efflux RND transporter periplasmic adaptor subunit n=1 Tax=Reichenbachiella sp. TaxID=2184521 RepID=UPI003265CED7
MTNFRDIEKMKNIVLILITLALTVSACGDEKSVSVLVAEGDLVAVRAKKKELSDQQKSLDRDIALLDSVINSKEGNKNLPLVTTVQAKLQEFDHFIELQGAVSTKQNVLIYPEASGILLSVKVSEGQKVSKGQLLATIDDGGMRNQLLQMKTQLELSKTTFERQKRLWDQKIGTEIQYLQAKSNYESQDNAVKQMEGQLRKFSIRAPFAGVIDDVIKEQGTVVVPGGPGSEVFRIINLSNMYLEVSVPETYISTIVVGKEVKINFPVLNQTYKSVVRQTGNYINPNNRSFNVEIAVPNTDGRIKPNMTAKVLINDYTNAEAILIPQSIISENAEGEQYAFVVSKMDTDNTAVANKSVISTGKTQGDFVEVLSGLKPGASLIKEGARSVKDGQQVKILTK